MIIAASTVALVVEFVSPWSHVRGWRRALFAAFVAWLIAHVAIEWIGDDIARAAAAALAEAA